jgi:hypothetical protein
MALNKARIRVAQMARVYLAPVGTAAPVDATAAPDPAWREVGFFTPDSLQWATAPKFDEVRSHQSNWPTRIFQTEDAATLQVNLQEWSADNFRAVYGGGTVTAITPATTPPQYRFAPPQIGAREEVAAMIEIIDGDIHHRRIIPVCQQHEGVTQNLQKAKESDLPLRLTIIGSDLGDPWYDLSDDPAFDPDLAA